MKTVKKNIMFTIVLLAVLVFNSCSSPSTCSKYVGSWVHQDNSSHVTSIIEVKANGENFSVTVSNSSEDEAHKFSSTITITAVCQYNILQLNAQIPLYDINTFTYVEKSDYLVTDKNLIYYKKK